METGFLDRLANQLKINKSATCRRASQMQTAHAQVHAGLIETDESQSGFGGA